MARPQLAGSLHAALAAAFDAVGRARAAHAMHVSESMVSLYADPGENGRPVQVQKLDALGRAHPAAAAALAEHFAALAGLCVVAPEAETASVSEAAASIAGSSASVVSLVLAAQSEASPGGTTITPAERAAIRAAAASLIEAGQALEAALTAVSAPGKAA